MFTATEVEDATLAMGLNPAVSGLLGGMTGGIAQAYATMGRLDFPIVLAGCRDNRVQVLRRV